MYLCNTFSLNMLPVLDADIMVQSLTIQDVQDFNSNPLAPLESAVDHPDTARVFSNILGFTVEPNRITLAFRPGNTFIVGQYRGPRLKTEATKLPDGATIEWWAVVVIHKGQRLNFEDPTGNTFVHEMTNK